MASNGVSETLQIHRLPQSKYIDALRWLPPLSAFDRFIVLASFDSDSDTSSIEIHSLNRSNPSNLNLHSSWTPPSRISSLRVSHALQKPLIAASTFAGSLHVLFADSVDASLESEVSVPEKALHVGPISCIDLQEHGSAECVSVGEDGRVNLVSIGDSRLNYRRVFDSKGLVSYTAAKWASPTEFATGGLGFSLQWWDQRKPGGPVSQFKGNWAQRTTSGIVHSIDIHPSRKHTCLAGGSSGTVFAWDLRWQKQPIILSGVGTGEAPAHSFSESEVWEVQYDTFTHSSSLANVSTARVLPVMICSEDGILAVVVEGEEPIELLAEPCAINSFDIDRQNPSFGMGVNSYLGKGITPGDEQEDTRASKCSTVKVNTCDRLEDFIVTLHHIYTQKVSPKVSGSHLLVIWLNGNICFGCEKLEHQQQVACFTCVTEELNSVKILSPFRNV